MSATEIDYAILEEEDDFGGITLEEIMGRGHLHQIISDTDVALMAERVEKSGVLEKLQSWREEDTVALGSGGRPPLISDKAMLTGMMLLAKEHSPMFVKLLAALFQYRLSAASTALLGLQTSKTTFVGHVSEQSRWYHNTHRAFDRMKNLMDPFPQERRMSKTLTEIEEILAAHNKELEEKRKARLDEFTKLFLLMTFKLQSRKVRRASKTIDVSFDQTYIETPTIKGYSRGELADWARKEREVAHPGLLRPGPVDAFAGWHVRTGPRTDAAKGEVDKTSPGKGKKAGKTTSLNWGFEANIAVRVDAEAPGQRRFPALAVAATVSIPNVQVAEEAVKLMRAAKETGLIPGVGDADQQYWALSKPERLHDDAIELGFTPSTGYRPETLGRHEGDFGASYIEGNAYCPSIPDALADASKDLREGRIDDETAKARINGRIPFKLHVKQKADAKGRAVFRCPALGPSPTVTCPLRELAKKATPKQRPAVDEADLPDFADKICQQHSVTFDTTELRRYKQKFDFGTPKWVEFHRHARNSIESLNAQVKSGGTEDIQSAGRRRVRGLAAAQMMVTMLLANFNIRKIAAFEQDRIIEDAKRPTGPDGATEPVRRRRDRVWHNPYTKTYPSGTPRPDNLKPPGPDDDGSGGPPLRL